MDQLEGIVQVDDEGRDSLEFWQHWLETSGKEPGTENDGPGNFLHETLKPRDRKRNFTEQETTDMLNAKLESMIRARSRGKRRDSKWAHDYASGMFRKYNVDRSYKSYQQNWDSKLKEFKAVEKHNKAHPDMNYWNMNEEDRIRYGMPKKQFPWEIYRLMCMIVGLEGAATLENEETEIEERSFAFQTEASVSEHLGDPSSSGRICQPVFESEGTAPAVMEDQPLSSSLIKLINEAVDQRFAVLVETLPFRAS